MKKICYWLLILSLAVAAGTSFASPGPEGVDADRKCKGSQNEKCKEKYNNGEKCKGEQRLSEKCKGKQGAEDKCKGREYKGEKCKGKGETSAEDKNA